MALRDILANSQLADDIVIEVNDGKGGKVSASLGEIRTMGASERQTLITRAQAVESAEQALLTRINTLKTAGLLDDNLNPITNARVTKQTVADEMGLDENDPLVGSVVKEMKSQLGAIRNELKTELDAIKGEYKTLAGATTQAVRGYLDDTYKREFSNAVQSLPEPLRDKVKIADVLDYAKKRNLTDETGRLDVARAVEFTTFNDVKDYELKKIKGESEQVKKDREALAAMNRPGATSISTRQSAAAKDGFSPVDDKGKPKTLDQALAEAANDDGIWNQALQTTGLTQ